MIPMEFRTFSELDSLIRQEDLRKIDRRCRLDQIQVRVESAGGVNRFWLSVDGELPALMSDWAAGQLLQKMLTIPFEFLQKRCSSELALRNVDNFLSRAAPASILVRMMSHAEGPRVRAVLPGARPKFEHGDILEITRQASESSDLRVASYRLDDTALTFRLLEFQSTEAGEMGSTDPHRLGLIARNSEIGHGPTEVHLTVVRERDGNGMLGLTPEPLLRVNLSGLQPLDRKSLIERLQEGLLRGLSTERERIFQVIRGARQRRVPHQDLDEELRLIHVREGLPARNIDLVKRALVDETGGTVPTEVTAYTLSNALGRAAMHFGGEEAAMYERAAWKRMAC